MIKNLQLNKKIKVTALAAFALVFSAHAQTFTFTSAGATGNTGPNQTQVNTAYASTNLNGMVTSSLGIQSWTVPVTNAYQITALGAEGGFSAGNVPGGMGASITGTFNLTAGQVLKILVGQHPTSSNHGGGGSFVTDNSNTPIIIAGGGGGGTGTGGTDSPNKHGQITTSGANGSGTTGGVGGSSGNGGGIGSSFASGAGGGLLTSGADGWTPGTGGLSYLLGGNGANANGSAGFGGGANGSGVYVGGGGGGYSGGGGATNAANSNGAVGGGGGSFNSATTQSNTIGVNSGDGKVIITVLCTPASAPVNNTFSGYLNICTNNTTTLSVVPTGTINWYSTPTSTTVLATGSFYGTTTLTAGTYTYYAASTNTCAEGPRTPITVTVNPTPTVSAVSTTSILCVGQTASLTASGAATYTWNTTSTNSVIAVSPTVTTSYTVHGADAIGCASNSFVITQSVSACTGISQSQITNKQLSIYPNPNNGDFIIAADSEMNLSVVNSLGQVVKVISVNSSNNYKATISNLTSGVYFVVGENSGSSIKQKVIVSK